VVIALMGLMDLIYINGIVLMDGMIGVEVQKWVPGLERT
jgi:hypothetical protein